MTAPTPPAVSAAMCEAVARDVAIWDDMTPGRRPCRLDEWLSRPSGPIASEIARLTGERDAALFASRAARINREAAEAALSRLQADRDAEVGKLRAALIAAETRFSDIAAGRAFQPRPHAATGATEARAALTETPDA